MAVRKTVAPFIRAEHSPRAEVNGTLSHDGGPWNHAGAEMEVGSEPKFEQSVDSRAQFSMLEPLPSIKMADASAAQRHPNLEAVRG